MEEAFDVMMRLFRGETVTEKTDWFTCDEAVLQMRPYSDFDIAVAASISPSGSKLAGKHGTGLLSIAATEPARLRDARRQLEGLEGGGRVHGHDRSTDPKWRLMGPMHIAETDGAGEGELLATGCSGCSTTCRHIIPIGTRRRDGDYDELVDCSSTRPGPVVIGTPEMAIAQIERLVDKSGGFGCYLFLGADLADWQATLRRTSCSPSR